LRIFCYSERHGAVSGEGSWGSGKGSAPQGGGHGTGCTGHWVLILKGSKHEVSFLRPSPDGLHLAVGYEDGSIRIFTLLLQNIATGKSFQGSVILHWEEQLKLKAAAFVVQSFFIELRVWDITYIQELEDPDEPESKKSKGSSPGAGKDNEEDEALELDESPEERLLKCSKAGSIMREGRDRVVTLATDRMGKILACHGTDAVLEVFSVLSEEEIKKKLEKKMKKAKKKCYFFLCVARLFLYFPAGCVFQALNHPCGTFLCYCSLFCRGFVTGGADKCVKFWDFELVKDESSIQKRLSMKQVRILQLDEDVLCVRYSPNQKLLAVSLLDCTVKVFYTDTLKFFLSLYGHKLPVLCMDISYDGTLIATGSADRNVKIWGMDFGDCHRSLFAHDDSVMYLQFVAKSHLFFTAGKDNKIKQWDADKFEHIQTLEGHHQEVWCLALSPNGDYVVSASHDKSLRLWERTREPLILEEEREMQREAEYEESVAKEEQPVVAGETQGETGLAGKKTIETIKATERIMEAIELYREEMAKLKEHKAICKAAGKEVPFPANPILRAYGNITVSGNIPLLLLSELEESLLVLPFSYVPDLLRLFNEHIHLGAEVELLCRALLFLLKIHFGQITSNQMLVTVIENLKKTTISRVSEARDVLGFNMAGLQYLKREIEAKDEVMFFADATDRFEEKKRKRKKKEKMILAVV
uniref:WD repeat domain 3 n=1 Tax=Chrysolophus pictus TaxID=9089 RepID=A0A8C3KUZ2_CHRPC